jgi:mitochondrial fission protein ELM1
LSLSKTTDESSFVCHHAISKGKPIYIFIYSEKNKKTKHFKPIIFPVSLC